MTYYSHKLYSTHSHIIGRTDPVTGDIVRENDTVVFCATCQSCFLEESWIYMDEKHCQQPITLDSVPALPSRLVIENRTKEIIVELKSNPSTNNAFGIVGFSFFVSFIGLSVSDSFFASDTGVNFILSSFAALLTGLLYSVITSSNKFKEFVGEKENGVRIFRNRIEIGKDSFSWSDIKQIKYQREMRVDFQEGETSIQHYIPLLLVYFTEGQFVQYLLPTKEYKKNAEFLIGMGKISRLTEVFFYSENIDEYQFMKNIQEGTNGNIKIGKPNKLFNNKGRSMLHHILEAS